MKKIISYKILREFGILVGIGIVVIVGWILPSISGESFRIWTIWISLLLIVAALFKPKLLEWPFRVWMKLGYLLGWVNSKLILGMVFVFVLQPIALIMKLFGYDPLRKKKNYLNTYKENRSSLNIDLKRIF